jgi:ribose/xylose/arabinose/galactoside ABC-type transport system permease subunit
MKQNKFLAALTGPWGQRVVILLILFGIMAVVNPRFFSFDLAVSTVLAVAVYGIMAVGMLFVVLIGELDLSLGSMAGFSASICFAITQANNFESWATVVGIIVALSVSLLVGLFHGVLVTTIEMPSFVLTLATKYLMFGLIPLVTTGSAIYARGETLLYAIGGTRLFGFLPSPIFIFIIIAIAGWFVLSHTVFGRRIYAIGGNRTAANFVGIKVKRDTWFAFMICSGLAGFGGIVYASWNTQVIQSTCNGYEGMVLMAMIVGGINLAGGKGTVAGAVFGALLIGIIQSMINMSSLGGEFLKFVQGAVILGAVIVSTYLETRTRRGKGRKAKQIAAQAAAAESED